MAIADRVSAPLINSILAEFWQATSEVVPQKKQQS